MTGYFTLHPVSTYISESTLHFYKSTQYLRYSFVDMGLGIICPQCCISTIQTQQNMYNDYLYEYITAMLQKTIYTDTI